MCSWTQKSLYVTTYSSIIHNSKKKQPKYLWTDQWINNMWYIHETILFGQRKEWSGVQFSCPLCKKLHSNNKLKVELLKNQLFQIWSSKGCYRANHCPSNGRNRQIQSITENLCNYPTPASSRPVPWGREKLSGRASWVLSKEHDEHESVRVQGVF